MSEQCPFCDRLSAYHDGELDAAARSEVKLHLEQCPACAVELAELSAMSQWFAEAPRPRLSQMGLYRLHAKADVAMQRGLLRVIHAVQAVAACVLVGASIALMRSAPEPSSQEVVQSAPPWMSLAVQTSSETNHLDLTTPAAAAYLADLTSRSEDYQ